MEEKTTVENEQEGIGEIYCWCEAEQDYVLVYRGTDAKEARRARRSFLSRQTRVRHKREKVISEIVQGEKVYSHENALYHLNNMVNTGKVAEILLKFMENDKYYWEKEIERVKKEMEEQESEEKEHEKQS